MLHSAAKGFNMALLHSPPLLQPSNDPTAPADQPHACSSMDIDSGAGASPQTLLNALANQKVANDAAKSQASQKSWKRKRRTCAKCAREGCPGSQRVANCLNPCRDCGKINCRGRNTKRPQRPCHLGWDCTHFVIYIVQTPSNPAPYLTEYQMSLIHFGENPTHSDRESAN